MKAIFYSPIARASPLQPSGVSRVAQLLVHALRSAGCEISTPRLPRTFDAGGDSALQKACRTDSVAAASILLSEISSGRKTRPDFWFTYHVYYKSPDWIGPIVSKELGIPYIVAEGSHAPKRALGPWALGHEGTTKALQHSSMLLAMTAFDRVCLDRVAPGKVHDLKPFIDVEPYLLTYTQFRQSRSPARLLSVAMMRNERKLASYQLLAQALDHSRGRAVQLSIAGDGPYLPQVRACFAPLSDFHKIVFLGKVSPMKVPAVMREADVFVWPGMGEAYGLVYLEAQAAGLPVVACRDRGVPDVTVEGETALLSQPANALALASNIQLLLNDLELCRRMSQNAKTFVTDQRNLTKAGERLRMLISRVVH